LRARLLASRGRFGEAETLARLAVAQAESTDFLGFHGDAYVALAEVLRLGGRTDGAIDALKSAIQLFERKGNVVEARRARVQQVELSG
jgi:Flp pilus assembly protein TadD